MRIECLSVDPEILLIRNFVTQQEAVELVAAANARLRRSTTVCDESSGCHVEQRTSSSATVPLTPNVIRIQERCRLFADLPFVEPVQVVRYMTGEEYSPHLDAFDPTTEGGRRSLVQWGGGQREATILIYLQQPESGGDTVFPRINLRVRPVPLAAVYWRNVRSDGSIDSRVLHGGAPVGGGTKYAANLWLRGTAQDLVYALALSEDVEPPTETPKHSKSAAIIVCAAGVGAVLGGPLGMIAGGGIGWTIDAIRRLTS